MGDRACTKCGEIYPETTEHFYKDGPHKLKRRCKGCYDGKQKEYFEANRKWLVAYIRDWREKNKRRVAVHNRRYRRKHPEVIKAQHKRAWQRKKRSGLAKYTRG